MIHTNFIFYINTLPKRVINMKRIGFIGWRGMVGSVLINRMKEKNNFNYFHSTFFSTSQAGKIAPTITKNQEKLLQDAWNIELLNSLEIIITCQGSSYTNIIYPKLKNIGWTGYWIDSASLLRMKKDTIIVLDPINQQTIEEGLNKGIKTFTGGNCTVSLMLMSLGGLFAKKLIEKIFVSTYQAASGYGAKAIHELLTQMGLVYNTISELLLNNKTNILDIENIITQYSKSNILPTNCFKTPLINNVIPWIGNFINNGQTQEEWKGQAETNKILNISIKQKILIDSLCVRVGSLRCHSQTFFLKLKKNISINNVKEILQSHNKWVEVIPNEIEQSLKKLTPIMVSGKLKIPIGRIRKMNSGKKYLSAFSVGDQLLWGAAEPLRRILLQLK